MNSLRCGRSLVTEDANNEEYGAVCCVQKKDGYIDYYHRSDLPEKILKASEEGNKEEIKAYINKDFDVNAHHEGENLLSRACATGQEEIVALLLQRPEIHVNRRFKKRTPLFRAARNGHHDCVRLILGTQGKCRPHLRSGWKSIVKVLKKKPKLSQESLLHILSWAGFKSQWEAVQIILQTDHHIPEYYMHKLIMQAADKHKWDIVAATLKREFAGKDETLKKLLAMAVQLRHWEMVKIILPMMNSELELELPLVQAAVDGDADEVGKLLSEQNYDKQTLNGCLLVVAAGETREPAVQSLLTIKDTYSKKTFSDALQLAAVGRHSEVIEHLLISSEASYCFSDFYKARKLLSEFTHHESSKTNCLLNILEKGMESKAEVMGLYG